MVGHSPPLRESRSRHLRAWRQGDAARGAGQQRASGGVAPSRSGPGTAHTHSRAVRDHSVLNRRLLLLGGAATEKDFSPLGRGRRLRHHRSGAPDRGDRLLDEPERLGGALDSRRKETRDGSLRTLGRAAHQDVVPLRQRQGPARRNRPEKRNRVVGGRDRSGCLDLPAEWRHGPGRRA